MLDQLQRQREAILLFTRRQRDGCLVASHRGKIIAAGFLNIAQQVLNLRAVAERFASFGTCDRVVQQTGTIPRERQVEDHVRPIWVKLCCLCQFLHCFGGLAVVDQYLSEALSKLAVLFWRQRC